MEFSKARISDVAEIERRSVPPTKIADGSLYVGLEHINGDGSFEQVGPVANGDLSSNKFAFNRDHVLFGKLRPYLRKTARPDFEGVCSTDILPLRPKSGKLDRAYLYHALRDQNFIDLASLRATGVNLPRLSPKLLANLEIPLPPLEEQRRIAAILDKADALRAKRREAIAKLDQLLQSVFLEMFGDPVKNPMNWPSSPLSELGSIDRGVSKHRPRNDPALLGGEHPLIQTGDVAKSGGYIESWHSSYSDLGLSQSKKWPINTLCITIAANIANTGILRFEACFPDSVVGFIPNGSSTVEYVQGLFGFFRKILDAKAPMSAQKNINLKILRGLEVPVPPINDQIEFSRIAAAIEGCRSRLMCSENRLDHLAFSLEQTAFET